MKKTYIEPDFDVVRNMPADCVTISLADYGDKTDEIDFSDF